MNKIVSFGAVAVAGVTAQMSNQDWANQNGFNNWQAPQQMQSMGSSVGSWGAPAQQTRSAAQYQGVPAPCGCAQRCPSAVRAVKSKKCCKPNPCKKSKAKTCTSPPEKVTTGCSSNPVCTHFKFAWTAPASCAQVKQYQIAIESTNQSRRELPVIPGHYSSYRVSQQMLQSYPFNLPMQTKVRWFIRAWSEYGWGEWSESLLGSDAAGRTSTGMQNQNPIGGSRCLWPMSWDPSQQRCSNGASTPAANIKRSLSDGTCNGVTEVCGAIAFNNSQLNNCSWVNAPKFQEECCTKILNPPAGCNCPTDCK